MPRNRMTANFSMEEFDRPTRRVGGKVYPEATYPSEWVLERLLPLCETLEVIREALGGKPIKVGSGYRDPAYNKAIGGALRSQHMQGRAADITVKGVPQAKVHATILELWKAGKLPKLGGLGDYPGRFVHVDVRPVKTLVRWVG